MSDRNGFSIASYEDCESYARSRLEWYQERRKIKIPNIIQDEVSFRRMIKLLRTRKAFSFDTETTGPRVNAPGVESLVGISLSWGYTHTYYIPVGHSTGEPQVSIDKVLKWMKPIFEDPDVLLIGHNLKFEMHVLANYGINIRPKADTGMLFDTMRACWLCDENEPNDLKWNANKVVGIRMLEYDEIVQFGIPPEVKRNFGLKSRQKGTMNMVPINIAGPYALDDAYCPWEMYKYYLVRLKEEGISEVRWKRDIMYNLGILFDKEREGIKVDLKRLKKIEKGIIKHMDELQYQIYERVGEFKITSHDQLRHIVFDVLGFPVLGYTKGGKASTDKGTIEDLMNQYYKSKKMQKSQETLGLIQSYLRLHKLLGFVNSIYENLYPDGKIHPTFKQLTVTGRLSCTDINMQQQPDVSKLEEDDVRRNYNLREVYVADSDDEVLIAADYSNLELRVLAHFSEDPNLLDAFARDQDVHSRTALVMFKPVDPEEYMKKDTLLKKFKEEFSHLRQAGKTLNFGLIYGMQVPRFAGTMSKIWKRTVSEKEAQKMFDDYFKTMPGVRDFINEAKRDAKRQGYVETITGRKRRLPTIRSYNSYERARAERQAVNSIIQGSAADIVIAAQMKLAQDKRLKKWGVKMLLQVHDEIVFKCKKKYVEKAIKVIKEIMEHPFSEDLIVDLVVDPSCGSSWAEAK